MSLNDEIPGRIIIFRQIFNQKLINLVENLIRYDVLRQITKFEFS
jgi:hypothetical protein